MGLLPDDPNILSTITTAAMLLMSVFNDKLIFDACEFFSEL